MQVRRAKQAEYSQKGEGSGLPQRELPKRRPFCPGRKEVKLNLESLGFDFRGTDLIKADIKIQYTNT